MPYNKENKQKENKQLTDSEKACQRKKILQEKGRYLMKYPFNELYIRWVFDDKTEGDDLIAYYVKNKKPSDKVVIVSADEGFERNLISDTVCIYNPNIKKFVSHKNFKELKRVIFMKMLLLKKIFCGDTSDNIGNIDGLSETRLLN